MRWGEDKNLWPVVIASVRLLQGAGRGKVFVEGEQNLLSYPEIEPNLHGCLDLLNRHDELGRLIAPEERPADGAAGGRHAGLPDAGGPRLSPGGIWPAAG